MSKLPSSAGEGGFVPKHAMPDVGVRKRPKRIQRRRRRAKANVLQTLAALDQEEEKAGVRLSFVRTHEVILTRLPEEIPTRGEADYLDDIDDSAARPIAKTITGAEEKEEEGEETTANTTKTPPPAAVPRPRSRKPKHRAVSLSSLSAHRTPREYICPRFVVFKERLVVGRVQRVWEVNFSERAFVKMHKKNFSITERLPFKTLRRIKMEYSGGDSPSSSSLLVVLVFKDRSKPYRLTFQNKGDLFRFYELGKMAISTRSVVWSPFFVSSSTEVIQQRQPGHILETIHLAGKYHHQRIVDGSFVMEEIECTGDQVRFSVSTPLEETTVWTGTFNLGGASLPEDLSVFDSFIERDQDVYVLCLQEANRKLDVYLAYFKMLFKKRDCYLISWAACGGVIIIGFVPRRHARKVGSIRGKDITFGGGGDGSAVVLQFRYNETILFFVGTQLCEGEALCADRWLNLSEIWHVMSNRGKLSDFGHCFLLGDLCYRVALPWVVAHRHAKKRLFSKIVIQDQLMKLTKPGGRLLCGWLEDDISRFAPTYPCVVGQRGDGMRSYLPGETPCYPDRILYRSQPSLKCQVLTYCSDPSIRISTHSPVSATFVLQTERCHVSHFCPPMRQIHIQLSDVYTVGRLGPMIAEPHLELSASWLEEDPIISTKLVSSHSRSRPPPVANPYFSKESLPPLKPINSKCDPRFLATKSIIVSLYDGNPRSPSSCVVGTSAIALLRAAMSGVGEVVPFEAPLEFNMTMRASLCGDLSFVGV